MCLQALIDYIKSDFDISVYWKTLNENGITKERLLSYDRAIHSEPSFRRDQKDGLLRDLGHYLRTLKVCCLNLYGCIMFLLVISTFMREQDIIIIYPIHTQWAIFLFFSFISLIITEIPFLLFFPTFDARVYVSSSLFLFPSISFFWLI